MRQPAKRVMEHFLGRSETLKRMKDTSGSDVDVPPHTARSKLYDKQSSVPVVSGHHSTRSCEQDVEKVVKTVLKGNILTQVNGRTQLCF